MTGAGQPRGGIAGWIERHPRGAGLAAVGGAIVLMGVAVVIGFALLSGNRPTGNTDPTPTPSAVDTPEPSVAPSDEPTPSEAPSVEPSSTPEPGIAHLPWPPAPDPDGPSVAGSLWLVSMVDGLSIRSGPGTEHPVVGSLDAGDLALALDGWQSANNWIPVLADGATGYANGGPEDGRYLLPTATPWKAFRSSLAGVASGGSDYVAWGPSYAMDYLPYEGGAAGLVRLSGDGRSWRSGAPIGAGLGHIAAGPDGLVATAWAYPGVNLVLFSPDGESWESVEAEGSAAAHGPAGWVVIAGDTAHRSADGRSWSSSQTGANPLRPFDGIESSDAGYVAFLRGTTVEPLVSADGIAWVPLDVPIGIDDWISDVELVGDRVFVLSGEPDTARANLHRGRLTAAGGVTWDGPPARMDDGAFTVANISAGPDGLLATGWSTDTLAVTTWSSADGSAWMRQTVSDGALGGSVMGEPAWGYAGWVTVGATPDGRGTQLWRSADGATWEPTGDPVIYAGPLPPCPPAEEISTLLLMYLEPYAGTCLGDASVTIRAWVPIAAFLQCCRAGSHEPPWLALSNTPVVQPAEAEQHVFSWLTLHVPDGVDASRIDDHAWLEITGHYRDAASSTCRLVPPTRGTWDGIPPADAPVFDPVHLLGPIVMVRECEEHFVVEAIAR